MRSPCQICSHLVKSAFAIDYYSRSGCNAIPGNGLIDGFPRGLKIPRSRRVIAGNRINEPDRGNYIWSVLDEFQIRLRQVDVLRRHRGCRGGRRGRGVHHDECCSNTQHGGEADREAGERHRTTAKSEKGLAVRHGK